MIATSKPPSVMINKIQKISRRNLTFSDKGKNIELNFNSDPIDSDGGLLLFRELDSQLNLISSASICIYMMHRDIFL